MRFDPLRNQIDILQLRTFENIPAKWLHKKDYFQLNVIDFDFYLIDCKFFQIYTETIVEANI